ncbi:N-acetyltransferase family protein [Roseomonas sp. M0104]|uniref:N-acetyltransferase family protein n=1 Tax=Teichococcus coralli TaxID=2545983 RepID=A0A845B5D0_9PROT|nr:GNAT family N-acetyltransferase [Pseudoroseomonas coralli]MXP62401.1 N-acetyltransferase family protein [Pseudoroseomonas coralli]
MLAGGLDSHLLSATFPAVTICPAGEGHLAGISAIFNEVVATSTAVYTEQPETLEQRLQWWRQRRARGFPVLVALGCHDSDVLGFASFAEFRGNWPGFRHTVEHSVHIRTDTRGRGVGCALVTALEHEARMLDKHVMVASVDAANAPSLRMHEKLGFQRVALMPQVGCKFGQWLDLVLLQKRLGDTPPR